MNSIAQYEHLAEMAASLQDHATAQVRRMHDDILKKVAKMVLGREPLLSDYNDFELATMEGKFGIELIAYKQNPIGRIRFIIDGNSYKYLFEPITSFN